MRPRPGFTILELMVVLAMVSVLGAIAMPRYDDARTRARAAQVVADMRQIMVAARTHELDHDAWPADEPAGVFPDGLDPYVARGVAMQTTQYTLDWENWQVPEGRLVGVAIETRDPRLGLAVQRLLGGDAMTLRVGDRFVFLQDAG